MKDAFVRRALLALVIGVFSAFHVSAQMTDINGPTDSGRFGTQVTALPNGNIVVTDPSFSPGGVTNVGAVYFYNGATRALISALTGSAENDRVGDGGVTVLANGNFVVRSVNWDNGSVNTAGAVTFANGTTGITGTISAANSLVGSSTFDTIGDRVIVPLPNGHYAVHSQAWDNGAIAGVGAITRGNGNTGTVGTINSTNSVIGGAANGGIFMNFVYDAVNNQIVVGRPNENIVTLFEMFAPTAANVSISGRVTNGENRSLSRAVVTLTDTNGNTRSVRVSSFGYYEFNEVEAGQIYIIQAHAKGLFFNPRVLDVTEDMENVNFESRVIQ